MIVKMIQNLENKMASQINSLETRIEKMQERFNKDLEEIKGFPGGSEVKASACNVGDLGSIPGLGRSPGEGNCNPLQYSCLENPMDRGAWWATVHGVAKSQTRLSDLTYGTSIVAVPIYIPTNGVGGFLSFHALSSTYCL